MLFNKKIDPCCAYCRSGVRLSETEVGCLKKGIVDAGGFCRRFHYDPLKREPAPPSPLKTQKFSQEDFSI